MAVRLLALGTLVLAGAAAAQVDPTAIAKAQVQGPAGDRPALSAALRASGERGGAALLAACLDQAGAGRPIPAASLDLLFELCPARESARVAQLLPALEAPGRRRLLRWMARRDLPGFRDFEAVRAQVIVAALDSEPELALEAARLCRRSDLDSVARGLAARIEQGITTGKNRRLTAEMCRSFVALRAASKLADALLAKAEARAPALVPLLLPALGNRPDLVLAGRIDAHLRARHPAMMQAVGEVVGAVDAELFRRVDHGNRLRLFRRLRRRDPLNAEWPLREAHVAIMDLGDPAEARAGLTALRGARPTTSQRVEGLTLAAIGACLDGRDPRAALAAAERLTAREWLAEPPQARVDRLLAGDYDDFELAKAWRRLVAPEIGEDEFARRKIDFVEAGGSVGLAWRALGRRRLAVLLAGYVMLRWRGDSHATAWLTRVASTVDSLERDYDSTRADSPDVEAALVLRTGPIELLTRACEGSEVVASRLAAPERERRLALGRSGFEALIEGLYRVMPSRVILPPGTVVAGSAGRTGTHEFVYLDVTAAYARYRRRLGEAAAAAQLFDRLIEVLGATTSWANRRSWANALFDRAQVATDRRNAKVGLDCLERYVKHYEDQLRDVRQNPNRYYDPDVARTLYAQRIASGCINLAVLHNVILHDVDTARGYCRRAYALDDSPFNRVLYACYLARDRQVDAALSLLATVDPAPPLYYNMACTYALAGDPGRALDYLALDLRINHPTPKARNRQREWALKDRDLASLRTLPRFRELVRRREVK